MVTFRGRHSTLCVLEGVKVKVQFLWQAQRIVVVVTFGEGDCRCDIGIGVSRLWLLRGWNSEAAWEGA